MACAAGPDVSESGLVLALDAADRYSFTLTEVEVLVVAGGGGGGGGDVGAGGGAGGLIYNGNFAVTPGSALTVTVGGGGAGSSNSSVDGTNGSNSIFGSLTAIGGGGGASWGSGSGQNGGSGGGSVSSNAVGQGTAGQGNNGGNGLAGPDYPQGGGGGAGGVGQTATIQTRAGDGGVGLEFPQFASVGGSPAGWFAGGGGGGVEANTSGNSCIPGTGGLGGGGNGGRQAGTPIVATSGATNTGGGGGGNDPGAGGNGGSGIVIVRYPGPQRAIGGTVTFSGGHTIHTFTTVGSATFTPLSASNGNTILGLSDLSNTGNFGTTVNSPTYSSANGGSIVFNGTDEYVTTTLGTYTPYCIDIWFKNDDDITSAQMQGNYQHLLGVGSYPGGIALGSWTSAATDETFSFFSAGWSANGMTYIRDTASPGIHNLVVNWNGSSFDFWLDGTKRTTYASSYGHRTLETVTGFQIGSAYNNANSYEFDGSVYSVKVYVSQLTDAQVQQNFNSLRGRFGI